MSTNITVAGEESSERRRFKEPFLNVIATIRSTSMRRVWHAIHASHTGVWHTDQQQVQPFSRQVRPGVPYGRTSVNRFSSAVVKSLGCPHCFLQRRLFYSVNYLQPAIAMFGQKKGQTKPPSKIFHPYYVWY